MIFIIPVVIIVGILAWVLRPGKSPTTARVAAILATAIPPVVVAIAAIVFQLLYNAAGKTWVSDISNTCFIAGLGLIGAAILVSAGFAFARKGEVAKGIGFGICIAIVVSIIELALLEGLAGV
jgi:hypothetical protein